MVWKNELFKEVSLELQIASPIQDIQSKNKNKSSNLQQ